MSGTLFDGLIQTASRRGFLSTAARAAGALALALIGVKPAFADCFSIEGCCLCANPASCTYGNCACEWSWPGDPVRAGGGCVYYLCYECYSAVVCPGATQTNGCPNPGWICSKTVYAGPISCGNGGGGGHCGEKPC